LWDLVIRNARVVDGSGVAWFRADVAVKDAEIKKIGSIPKEDPADRCVDAKDKVLAPGFIDIHNHADFDLLRDPSGGISLRQGVTTIFVGQCGLTPAPVTTETAPLLNQYCGFIKTGETDWRWRSFADWTACLDALPLGLSVGTFVGQGTIRLAVMGFDDRLPTRQQLDRMRDHAREASDAGAFGMTTGLGYPPGFFSTDEEIEFVAGGIAERRGLYLSHMRNQAEGSPESVRATINVGRVNNIPVQIVHLKAKAADRSDMAAHLFSIIEDARKEGVDVTVDQYPYTASSTTLRTLIPNHLHNEGVAGILTALENPAKRKEIAREMRDWPRCMTSIERGIMLMDVPMTPEFRGMTLSQASQTLGIDEVDALLELICKNRGNDSACFFTLDEDDVRNVMAHPLVMIGSDGSHPAPGTLCHPRTAGTFPRVLGRYVRELRLLTLEEAVRKMTSLPAARLSLWRKGLLREGMDADMVLFDPDLILDGSTHENPLAPPIGIEKVWVAGVLACENNELTPFRKGRLLRYRP
jgi:N-acyl-D-amino-acid deacylase